MPQMRCRHIWLSGGIRTPRCSAGLTLRRVIPALITLILTAPVAAVACPSCKAAIEHDPVAAAFNSTTLLMIAAPISLVGSIGGWVVYRFWRSVRRGAQAEHAQMVWGPILKEEESET